LITLDDLPAEVRAPHESQVVGQQNAAGPAGAGVGVLREAGQDRGSVPGAVANGIQGTQPFRLDDLEKAHVVEILRQQNGNKARAARVLGIHRRKLYRLLERHGLHEERPIS
jgi:transcriptional regulator of acetoin/glycerol metabolism